MVLLNRNSCFLKICAGENHIIKTFVSMGGSWLGARVFQTCNDKDNFYPTGFSKIKAFLIAVFVIAS